MCMRFLIGGLGLHSIKDREQKSFKVWKTSQLEKSTAVGQLPNSGILHHCSAVAQYFLQRQETEVAM